MLQASLEAHTARDTARSIALARRAIAIDPSYAPALEHLGTLLVTRLAQYAEGLEIIDRAVAAAPDDAAAWYTAGWCYEFAAHELRRRPRAGDAATLDPHSLYERAAEAFRACLDRQPEGKLRDDAEDLLDHVENELASF